MSKLFNSILQGFKEFGEITNNKSLLNQIDEIETLETFEEDTAYKSIYTIDYVDNTGASFKDRIRASSEEDALKKFNKKSKNFVNGVRKIKGHPYIDYLDDDASYDEIDDLTEDTQLKFDGDMINDIDVLYGWRPQEVERILIKHGSDKNNDNWIDGLDLPAAYDEIMSTFRDKYSDDDEIDYDAAKVLGLIDESLKESFRMSRDDFNRMCKENGILQGLSRRDYMEIRDLFHAGSESFDSAVNDLWHGDDDFHSRDWYENLLKKYTNQESLKEAKKLRAPKFWNTNFSDNVIKDYEAGKLTFDNIEEWDAAYNGGRKPNPPFNTKEILDYYLATKESFKGEDDKMKLKINEATDNQYLYCQASIEDDIRDYLTDDELSEISSYIGSDGTIINCEFGRCDIQFSDEFIAHQIPVEYLNIEMDESLNEDALDDHGVSRVNVNLLAKRIPNGRFYFNRNRYVLGKELPDYFDDNEVILCSDYQDSDGIRIPNAYNILKRFTEDFSSITALADDCGKNTFKTSERDIRFTFNDEKSAIKFMDELRDKNIYFDELPRGVIKVNKSVALGEIYKREDGKIKLKINEDTVKNGDFYVGWAKVNIDKFYDYMTSHPKLKIYKRGSDYYVATSEHDSYAQKVDNSIIDTLKLDPRFEKLFVESKSIKESIMSTEEFLKWHDDPENYRKYRDKFYAIYDIFDEYGFSDNEDVDTEYERLSYEDQVRVTNIIKDTQTESLKLKESTNSLDDYKVYEILINTLVPNSINLARHLSPNGECYNEIVDVLKKNGLNLAEQWIDYKENPELTKRLHDMGIVHGNSTIEELTDKVLKKLDDNGYDTSDKDVRNYAEAAAELIINDVNQDIDDWYSETLINYPEDLEELPKK